MDYIGDETWQQEILRKLQSLSNETQESQESILKT
ncbi:hypothetical protein BMMGA3_16865 (plasmid) [Bacillus methanolicus MGA3]|uniref:Uncharacterized protein n=1 Tax=Bacillus methanolicus (strain MGA3 / ATCC 53907) TaxID=796606 RepID=A0A068M1X1_BACMM|nr:hypothetical protein BMMGA3_16865 [Bacillus methanolicus MGA3]